jgi:acyl carrier protein
MTTQQQVTDILARQFGVVPDTITATTDVNQDLGADSLDIVELVMSLERTFKIVIEEEEYIGRSSVQSIVDLVNSKLG